MDFGRNLDCGDANGGFLGSGGVSWLILAGGLRVWDRVSSYMGGCRGEDEMGSDEEEEEEEGRWETNGWAAKYLSTGNATITIEYLPGTSLMTG